MYRMLFLCCALAIACNNPQAARDSGATTATAADLPVNGTVTVPPVVSTDSAIAYIRNAFRNINSASLRTQVFKWDAENCNGDGTATYYFTQDDQVAKILETGIIGDSYWETSYYYQEGQFVFSLETNIGGPAIGAVDTFTIRKYAYNNKVIRILRNNSYTTPQDSVLTPASKEYRIVEAYKHKNFGAAFCQ